MFLHDPLDLNSPHLHPIPDMSSQSEPHCLTQPVAVIGSGVAGLITAHTLVRDGFTDVHVLTKDATVGGVWARERIYPGLELNSLPGEYRFSPLDMPPPAEKGARLSGEDVMNYLETFASKFLQGRIHYNLDVSNIRRGSDGTGWKLDVLDLRTSATETRTYARLVVCTGGCSNPQVPDAFNPAAVTAAGFKGIVIHSADLAQNTDALLSHTASGGDERGSKAVVVIGGGKSAQDACVYFANEGRDVTMVCHKLNAFTATPKPLPDYIRRSRLVSMFSPHIHLRTFLERFLHTTWLGKKIVDFVWRRLIDRAFEVTKIPQDSPLRNTFAPFWNIQVNDEGTPRPNGFHALVLADKIKVFTLNRAVGFGDDGQSVLLKDGSQVPAAAIILATGYKSSWEGMFGDGTMEALGVSPHPANRDSSHVWNYKTLANPPPLHPDTEAWSSSILRGIVPAKNIANRDFAVNGACIAPSMGYTMEVASHWISAYFLGDNMRIPQTPEAAFAATEREAAWLKRRYPEIPTALYPSRASYLAFWTWPQHADDLLEDLGLPIMRGGGNALTWPFKVIQLEEIRDLKEERDEARRAANAAKEA
ncbi:FAD/NAD-P-binding domain-containing protein [Lenzites betulinus]|nr:FAD/NAD-P-binding domain-containing protein [Lenzites betulinus]